MLFVDFEDLIARRMKLQTNYDQKYLWFAFALAAFNSDRMTKSIVTGSASYAQL